MNKLSKCVVTWLIKNGTILEEDRELYEFAAYSFFISISPVVSVMIIGGMMGKMIESILIIVPFMFLRKFSGGFHARHAWVCMIFSCVILFICVYISTHITYGILINIAVICAAISLMLFSPIDSENRRLGLSEKKEFKVTTIILVIFFVIIYRLLLIVDNRIYAICIAEGIILTAGLQIPCILQKIKLTGK